MSKTTARVGVAGAGNPTVEFVAASVSEAKSGGLGTKVEWGFADSPFGRCSIGRHPRGICHLAFHDSPQEGMPDRLLRDWPKAEFSRNDDLAARMVEDIFERGTAGKVFMRGTVFQLKVWRALLQIPGGCLASYSDIAAAVGSPRASRAVGTACGANPVAYLVPCHRVIHSDGSVEGYGGGTERKIAMIARENPR